MLQVYSVACHSGNFSKRETGVCLHTEFQSASPFSLVMQWSASHGEQPWFFLFCWPLGCWENTSRALVQAGCGCSTECHVKNFLPFLNLRRGCFCLPAPFCEALPIISAHSSHKDDITGSTPETHRSGRTWEDILQQTRDPHYML